MEEEKKEEMSFAELFEAHPETPGRDFHAGGIVTGIVVKITKETIFVDLGGKSEGMVGVEEFLDKGGNVTVKKGDRLELRIASVRDGIHLSKGIKVHGAEALDLLRDAKENLVPVEGRVTGVNKGGFEVEVSGHRAFCPVSQMELRFCEKPEEHIGSKYMFRIMEITDRGRNILVSRRVLLQEEQEKKMIEMKESLKPGLELTGKVTKLTAYGAFVDIGGLDGMVHVSEMSHARVGHPSDVLKPGDEVRVKVLRVESDKGGRPKIGLSMKALEPDAWEKGLGIQEGEIIQRRISRLADFGAFVEVAPGVDGLVPVSEISFERVTHPKKYLKEGEMVEVLVMKVDEERRRISLSIKEASIKRRMLEQGMGPDQVRLDVGQVLNGIVEDSKPYGIFVRLPQFGSDVRGLLPMEELVGSGKQDVKKKFPPGTEVQVEIIAIDEKGRIKLSQKSMGERADRESYSKFLQEKDSNGLGTFGDLLGDLKLDENPKK